MDQNILNKIFGYLEDDELERLYPDFSDLITNTIIQQRMNNRIAKFYFINKNGDLYKRRYDKYKKIANLGEFGYDRHHICEKCELIESEYQNNWQVCVICGNWFCQNCREYEPGDAAIYCYEYICHGICVEIASKELNEKLIWFEKERCYQSNEFNL